MSSDSAEIAGLLARLHDGDQQALGELFSLYREALRRMVELRLDRRLKGRVSASDVLQETYIDALKRVHHYVGNDEMPFLLWLRQIAQQCMIDIHRRHLGAQMRNAGLELSLNQRTVAAASSICLAGQLMGTSTSPSHAAMRDEVSVQLEQALESLDPIDREVLALRHFEELSNNETAAILGLQKHAASKRYIRALSRLKEALAAFPCFFEEPTG